MESLGRCRCLLGGNHSLRHLFNLPIFYLKLSLQRVDGGLSNANQLGNFVVFSLRFGLRLVFDFSLRFFLKSLFYQGFLSFINRKLVSVFSQT